MTEPTAREAVNILLQIDRKRDRLTDTEWEEARDALIARLERAEADWLREFQRSLRAEADLVVARAERDRAQAWIRETNTQSIYCLECGEFRPYHAPGCYVAELQEKHDDA